MTTKTTYVITAILALSVSITGLSQIYASNTTGYWNDYTQNYICHSSLSTINHTANVDPCNDLETASDKWNDITSSNWSLTEAPSGSGIYVYGWSDYLDPQYVAATFPLDPTSPFDNEGKWVVVNKSDYWFGDPAQGDTEWYDYMAVMTHEFGHVAGIDHNSQSDSVMQASLGGTGLAERDPNDHDEDMLQGLY